jgi:hypothetical protein
MHQILVLGSLGFFISFGLLGYLGFPTLGFLAYLIFFNFKFHRLPRSFTLGHLGFLL